MTGFQSYIYFCDGNPNGRIAAAVGEVCRDRVSGNVYAKRAGSGNTGWFQLKCQWSDFMGVLEDSNQYPSEMLFSRNAGAQYGSVRAPLSGSALEWFWPSRSGTLSVDNFQTITGTSFTIQPGGKYKINTATLCTANLPATFPENATFEIVNIGNGGWKIGQGAGQSIYYEGSQSTVGASGNLTGPDMGSAATILCITANTTFMVTSHEGMIALDQP